MDISTFTKPLIEENITSPKWTHTTIHHGQDSLAYYKLPTHLDIAKSVVTDHNTGGIYAYFQKTECLYIGKSKLLWARVRDHLQESCGLANANRGKKWNAFFSSVPGDIDLHLLPLGDVTPDGEALRKIVEILLTQHHKPKFLNFEKSLSNNQTN